MRACRWVAATLLGLIGENGGCVVFARLAVMYGLRKGVRDDPSEYSGKRCVENGRGHA
jgi:hypothetical protein